MNFYVLEPDGGLLFGTKWAYADQMDPVRRGEGDDCPVCGGPIGGLRWLPPHRIKLSSAKPEKWGDILWGAGFLLMVSDRFKMIYEAEGLTGITVFHPRDRTRGQEKDRGSTALSTPVSSYRNRMEWGQSGRRGIRGNARKICEMHILPCWRISKETAKDCH